MASSQGSAGRLETSDWHAVGLLLQPVCTVKYVVDVGVPTQVWLGGVKAPDGAPAPQGQRSASVAKVRWCAGAGCPIEAALLVLLHDGLWPAPSGHLHVSRGLKREVDFNNITCVWSTSTENCPCTNS